MNLGYQFSRLSSRVTLFFEDRENVSGKAGIAGNNQDPPELGPAEPQLRRAASPASPTGKAPSIGTRRRASYSMLWNRRAHNVTFGADFRRQQFNYLAQQDPRGTFTFTGLRPGSDFASIFCSGFQRRLPSLSATRTNTSAHPLTTPISQTTGESIRALTLNAGCAGNMGRRSPRLYGRLVNLDIAPGFSAAAPIAGDRAGPSQVARIPTRWFGPIRTTSRRESESPGVRSPARPWSFAPAMASTMTLRSINPSHCEWRSSLRFEYLRVVRTTQPICLPWRLASPLATSGNTFAVDPDFRIGYAQNWQLSIQRDLPAPLQMTASYLGIKGTRGAQEFLPNTFPTGAATPCDECPAGFALPASNGNSSRESAQLQLRRRLRNGLPRLPVHVFEIHR